MAHVLRTCVVLAVVMICSSGCAVPVAYGRTGKVLDDGYVRYGLITGTGVMPLQASPDSPEVTQRAVSLEGEPNSDAARVLLAPLPSLHLHGSLAVGKQCEGGAFVDLTRYGAEFRCGRQVGGLDAALSAALMVPGYARTGPVELRAGVDLSRARGDVVPLFNVYVGYVPAVSDSYRDANGEFLSVSRSEYRLSAPIGVSFIGGEAPVRSIFVNTTLSVIPELVFGELEPDDPALREPTLDPTWAVFLMLRFDVVQRTSPFAQG